MRLLALTAVILFSAGSALACSVHTAGHDTDQQTVAKKLPQSTAGKQG